MMTIFKTMPTSPSTKRGTTVTRTFKTMALCVISIVLAKGCVPAAPVTSLCTPPEPFRLVIVIEENKSYSNIIGSLQAPFINRLASEGANFTQSFGVARPSQPNYLALFSGSTQNIFNNSAFPHSHFNGPNLGAKLLAAGRTFGGYSETLPSVGWNGNSYGNTLTGFYRRKHNPWVNWQSETVPLPENKLPPSVNMPFQDFPTNFDELPDVSIVVPNERHNMHDGSIGEADSWLEQNLASYVEWAKTNNGLLILTWDEDDGTDINHIVTVFHGPMVQRGQYGGVIYHYNVLRTIEDIYGLPHDDETVTNGPVPCEVWPTALP